MVRPATPRLTGVMIYLCKTSYLQQTISAIEKLGLEPSEVALIDYSPLFIQLKRPGLTSFTPTEREVSKSLWESLNYSIYDIRSFEPETLSEGQRDFELVSKAFALREVHIDLRISNLRRTNFIGNRFLQIEQANGVESYGRTLAAIDNLFLESLVVLNGRYPAQVAAAEAARIRKLDVRFLEKGTFRGPGTFLRTYPTRDHSSVFRDGLKETANLSDGKVILEARAWLQSRSSSSPVDNQPILPGNISFFSSSQNELIVAEQASGRSYANQFGLLKMKLNSMPLKSITAKKLIIRLHPGLQDRSPRDFLAQIVDAWRLKKLFEARIIGPFSEVSSYQIMSESSSILVAHSTVGIEAAIMGKPINSLWDSEYTVGAGIPVSDLSSPKILAPDVGRVSRVVVGNLRLDSANSTTSAQIFPPNTSAPGYRRDLNRELLNRLPHYVKVTIFTLSGYLRASRDSVWAVRKWNKEVNSALSKLLLKLNIIE